MQYSRKNRPIYVMQALHVPIVAVIIDFTCLFVNIVRKERRPQYSRFQNYNMNIVNVDQLTENQQLRNSAVPMLSATR